MPAPPGFLRADFPQALNVSAGTTTRAWPGGGCFGGRAAPLKTVQEQRSALAQALRVTAICWLDQVHGVDVLRLPGDTAMPRPSADAAWTDVPGVVCAVLTADCLPVLFAATDRPAVAAAHAGWRGLLAGVLEQTVRAMDISPAALQVWLGPAIGPRSFEVGPEVRAAFVDREAAAAAHFLRGAGDRWFADLYGLARRRLQACGVPITQIRGGAHCTLAEPASFHSYRRDGADSGRMASVIMREPD